MEKYYTKLLNEFMSISKLKWIKGINSFTNSAGLTFESLLKKQADSMFFPDYYNIEIKCTQRFSRYPITLFSKSFDGPSLYQMNILLNKYGKNDIIFKNKKLLNSNLSCNKKILFDSKYFFKLDLDKKKKRIYFSVYDINNSLIEREAFIDFETLKSHLQLKLSNLAVVWASKKVIDNNLFFRYYKITIYKLISFDKFIELLEKDIIIVDIIGRISRSGVEAGRQRNKNLVFKIPKDSINQLFNVIKTYDADLNTKFIK